MRYLVTGGAGFIGSNFVKYMLGKYKDIEIVNLDILNYAGREENLLDISNDDRHQFIRGDICDINKLKDLVGDCDIIVNFAAESHVDRSVNGPLKFVDPNIMGVVKLLEFAREKNIKLFAQISTDEVYGDVLEGFSKENHALNPNNPYSASKAAAEMMVNAYVKTYKIPAIITRSSNNYGPCQYPEKIIPFFIIRALNNKKLPLHGDGSNIRDWLYVKDNCEAIDLAINKGKPGEVYNIARNDEKTNLQIAQILLNKLDKPHDLIQFVDDRPWNDLRYALDTSKIKKLGWEPKHDFEKGIDLTIEWYLKYQKEVERMLKMDMHHPMNSYIKNG